MATGMPIVSTLVGGVPYVVGNDEEGLLSDYADVNTFADHLTTLLKDHGLWSAMSASARQKASDYHWQRVGGKIMDVYRMIK